MKSQIKSTLLKIISKITGTLALEESEGPVLEIYGLDSIQAVSLIIEIEENYGLLFGADPDDIAALSSLDLLCDWIDTRA
jgi:acyl carrier protein